MSIYRGRRSYVSWQIATLLAIGTALGGVLLWAARKEPEPPRTGRPDLIQALVGALEIIPVSYGGAVHDGAILPGREVQYRGAQDAIRRARALFGEAQAAITAQDVATARLAEETLREIEEAMTALRPPTDVRRLTDRLTQALKGLPSARLKPEGSASATAGRERAEPREPEGAAAGSGSRPTGKGY